MESISPQQRGELVNSARTILKLELRDNYAADAELFAAYRAGDTATVRAAYQRLREEFTTDTANGLLFRRVRIVSTPLSSYQQMALDWSSYTVEGGDQLRWLPRRLVSQVPLPGNECSVLDDEAVIFLVFDSADECVETQVSRDPGVVKFCRDTFEALWSMSIPHAEFKP
jgi:hypothetical protein